MKKQKIIHPNIAPSTCKMILSPIKRVNDKSIEFKIIKVLTYGSGFLGSFSTNDTINIQVDDFFTDIMTKEDFEATISSRPYRGVPEVIYKLQEVKH